MSRTAPVQIVNKNGVRTTVHKLVDNTAPSTKASGVPKPTLPAPEKQTDYKALVETSIAMSFASQDLSDDEQDSILDTLHPDTKVRLEQIYRDKTPDSGIRRAMSWSIKNRSFSLLNTMVALVPELADNTDTKQQNKLMYVLAGMQKYRTPGTAELDITNPDDSRTAGIRPFVNALLAAEKEITENNIDHRYQQTTTFKDPDLGNLILERHDRADEIIALYRSRGAFDRELFEDALDNGTPALNEGKL